MSVDRHIRDLADLRACRVATTRLVEENRCLRDRVVQLERELSEPPISGSRPTPERFRELDGLDPGPYPLDDAGDEKRW